MVLREPREVEPELVGENDLLDRIEVPLMLLRALRPLGGLEEAEPHRRCAAETAGAGCDRIRVPRS
jgi:hypothetical protein